MKKVKKISVFILWTIFVAIVVIIAAYLIIIANGYKINWRNYKIQKTGMIFLKSEPKETEIWVDGKLLADKTPFKYQEIFPGRYEVKLVKYGYVDWVYLFNVEQGMVSSNTYIKQFLSSPEVMEPTKTESNSLDKLAQEWQSKGLIIKSDNEIWFNDVLVTRFSESVKKVVWHSDLKHIFFQVDKELRVMEPDGANNTKLADLESENTSIFVPLENGKYLLYSDGDSTKKIRIQ